MTTMKPAAGSIARTASIVSGRVSFLHDVLGAFSPNRVISKAAFRFIIAFQVAVLLIVGFWFGHHRKSSAADELSEKVSPSSLRSLE